MTCCTYSGVMSPPVEQLTEDGYDLQFGTNCVGHWYLTKLLLPTLLETAKASSEHSVRVITTSSSTHHFAPKSGIYWDTIERGEDVEKARKKVGTRRLYAQSKFVSICKRLHHPSVLIVLHETYYRLSSLQL